MFDPVLAFYIVVPGALAWVFYFHASGQKWTETEKAELLQREMELFPILDLLGGDDVRTRLLANYRYRRETFFEYSKGMRRDVGRLLRSSRVSFTGIGLVAILYVSYALLRLKSLLYCNYRDVFFLSGLELSVFRSLQR